MKTKTRKAPPRREMIKVYVGPARPSYDTAPQGEGLLTDKEASHLRNLIGRYLKECRERAERELDKAGAPKGEVFICGEAYGAKIGDEMILDTYSTRASAEEGLRRARIARIEGSTR